MLEVVLVVLEIVRNLPAGFSRQTSRTPVQVPGRVELTNFVPDLGGADVGG